MKKFFKILLVLVLIVSALCGGYFVGYNKIVDINELFGNKNTNITYEQVVEVLEVVCENNGYSIEKTSQVSSKLSNMVYADGNGILEFGINQNYFKSIPGVDLNKYVKNSTFYAIYYDIIEAMSIEISNDSLKMNEVKKTLIDAGTEFESEIYYYLSTKGNEIIIDWTSAAYINGVNTGLWKENTCVGYRLSVDYDLDNFDDEKYVVKQGATIQHLDNEFGYSFIYQNINNGKIQDCGYSDFTIIKDANGNINKSSANSLIVENVDLVNNKACFLEGSDGQFWFSGSISEEHVDKISNDIAFNIVSNITGNSNIFDELPSLMYITFCTK